MTNVTVDGGVFGLLALDTTELDVIGSTFSNTGIGIDNGVDVTILKNRIVGAGCGQGIDLAGDSATRIRIWENVVTGCRNGILVGVGPADIVIGKNNLNANAENGIFLIGSAGVEIVGNRVHLNGVTGIGLVDGSTGNIIEGNKVTGNGGVDLFHDEGSSPNEWIGNTCDTSDGADIDCLLGIQ